MPDENCRNCGGELAKYLLCGECKKTIQKVCRECSKATIQQTHISCFSTIHKTSAKVALVN